MVRPRSYHYETTLLSLSMVATAKPHFWRLNESLLKNPTVLVDITNELAHYFLTNDQPDCDLGILWEAHKMVIIGILIKHGTRIKREREKQLLMTKEKVAQKYPNIYRRYEIRGCSLVHLNA